MSIRPVKHNADRSIDVVHDDAPDGGHSATIPVAALVLGLFQAATVGGAPTHNAIALACPFPGCGSVSVHPVGGGAAPAEVHELFVRMVARLGCPCGGLPAGRPVGIVKAHIKLQAERMDGIGRWQGQAIT